MAAKLDLGLEVLNRVRLRPERSCLTQRIWSEPASCDARATWRVNVRTGFLAGFDGSRKQLAALSRDMAAVAFAAVIRDCHDATRLQLASTVHVHAGNVDVAPGLIADVAALQRVDARRLATSSALLALGALGDPAAEQDPGAPIAAAEDGFSPAEVQRELESLAALAGVRAVATPCGLIASLAMPHPSLDDERAVLELDATALHPGLGRGLSALLVTPLRGGVQEALALNEREAGPEGAADLLGGWTARRWFLTHRAFLPHAVRTPELVGAVVRSAVRRVEWLRSIDAGGSPVQHRR